MIANRVPKSEFLTILIAVWDDRSPTAVSFVRIFSDVGIDGCGLLSGLSDRANSLSRRVSDLSDRASDWSPPNPQFQRY